MHPRQRPNFSIKSAEVAKLATVGTDSFFHDGNAEGFFLNVFENLLDFEFSGLREFFFNRSFYFVAKSTYLFTPLYFGSSIDGVLNPVTSDSVSDLKKIFLGHGDFVVALLFTSKFHKFFLCLNDLCNSSLSEVERLFELCIRNLISSTLDHDDVGLVPDIDEVKIGVFALFEGGIDDKFAIDASNANGADGASEGNVGNRKSG